MSTRIIQADFERTVVSARETDFAQGPAVAFAGRSNVGKSSLLNALCGRKALATTSKTPGRTRALNFFTVRLRKEYEDIQEECEGYFVDIPGYGFAKVSRAEQRKWAALIEGYLFENPWLRAMVVLIDARRGVREEEFQLVHFERDIVTIPVLTKIDKLSKSEVSKARTAASKALGIPPEDIIATSSVSGKQRGIEDLLGAIYSSIAEG